MLPALLKFSSAAHLLDKFPLADRTLHAGYDEAQPAEDRAVLSDDEDDTAGFGGGALDSGLLDALPL